MAIPPKIIAPTVAPAKIKITAVILESNEITPGTVVFTSTLGTVLMIESVGDTTTGIGKYLSEMEEFAALTENE
jgi:hypothetical protein